MSTPTLRWLQIHQYEQFEPVRIEFSPKENLILGLNGAGKTQLLKLVWAVLSLSLEELGERELHFEFESIARAQTSAAEVTIRGEVKTTMVPEAEAPPSSGPMRRTSGALDVSLKLSSGGKEFEFRRSGRVANILDVHGNVLATDYGPGSINIAPDEFAWDWDIEYAKQKEIWDMMPRRGCCAFGESDEEFRILTGELELEVRQRRGGAPGDYIRVNAGKLAQLKPRLLWDLGPAAHKVTTMYVQAKQDEGVELAALVSDSAAILRTLGAVELRLIPDFGSEIDRVTTYKGVRVRLRFPSGADVRSSELTFGQRRYLYAAIISSAHPDKPVVCDEIDNGMHPRLVLALLEMWSDRQVFVASHNQLVIDSTNFYSPADVREKIHIVRRRDDGRQVVKVFDDETAREIHAAIDVKIQRPSDVLEAEGLW